MKPDAARPALIGIDWGTTSLRGFVVDARGAVLDRVSTGKGVMNIKGGAFEAALHDLAAPWLAAGPLPVVASGMITSRNGWVETPYAPLPLDAGDLARALVRHVTSDGIRVHFVTGATTRHGQGRDVMRGEETQIVGACAGRAVNGVFVLPGTHSKWIRVETGRITDFTTYMTGDVFAALRDHTILKALIEDAPFSPDGFARGVALGLERPADLLHRLFQIRTLPLFGDIDPAMTGDCLSGLLIGTEIAAAAAAGPPSGPDLADRYAIALTQAGIACRRAPEDIVATGHYLIAKAAGLLP
jgi:2-dehydro-3-deoxygalactonokinase